MIKEKLYEIKSDNEILGNVKIVFEDKWGKLKIKSIYGDFFYAWYSLGSEFRKFLGNADINYYLTIKLIDDEKYKVFDPEGTIKNIKEAIIKNRRNCYVNEKEARYAWDNIPKVTDEPYVFQSYVYCEDVLEGDLDLLTSKYIEPIQKFREIFLPKMQKILLEDYYNDFPKK